MLFYEKRPDSYWASVTVKDWLNANKYGKLTLHHIWEVSELGFIDDRGLELKKERKSLCIVGNLDKFKNDEQLLCSEAY